MFPTVLVLTLLLFIGGALTFDQSDYSIAFDRVELVRYNKQYMRSAKIVTFKYNRTQAACNASFDILKDFGNHLEMTVQAYTFLSNEYRIFPIRLGLNFCNSLTLNDAGMGDIVHKGLFDGCPMKKGMMLVYNWKPNPAKFPPFIPNGQYKLEMQINYFSSEVWLMSAYGTVSRPLGRRH